MKVTAIILAAGNGSRMNSDVKKQYIELLGKPVLWHTICAFQESSVDEIVIVTGEKEIEYCKQLAIESGFYKVKKVIAGGAERYNSVYEGLIAVEEAEYVLIHDGARPVIQSATIEKCIERVKECKACVVGVPVKDTIKIVDEEGRVEDTPNRNKLWSIQTPQAFCYSLIKESYEKMLKDDVRNITDDAMVVELYSEEKVHMVQGEYTNIKITTKDDLVSAENFLKKLKKSVDIKNV